MRSGGSENGTSLESCALTGRSCGRARTALAGLAVLIVTGAAAPPSPPVPTPAPPQVATDAPATPDAAAKPEAAAAPDTDLKAEIAAFAPLDLFGALIGMLTYRTAFTAVTEGAMSAATGAIGIATAAGATAGLIWAGYGPGDEKTNYWDLVPAGLGALGGIAVGEVVAYGLFGYSPFAAGVAGYVPLTSLTFARYANGAYAYMSAILGAKAALGLYSAERPDDAPRNAATPAPAPLPAPPAPASPAPPLPGEHGA